MDTVPVIGLQVAVTDYDGAVAWVLERAEGAERAYAVAAANTHVAAHARRDAGFGEAMGKFDLVCPDGMPIMWSVNTRLPGNKRLKDRVYGPSLMLETLRATESRPEFRHFLLGGREETLDKLQRRFAGEFPRVDIAGTYSPPFGDWPGDEFERISDKIRRSGANLVWVGLGCPKQEQWIGSLKDKLPPAVYFGIGAAFAFHAGEIAQAPAMVQKCGLEWAYRLLREPRRLFRRYFTYNSLFLYYSLRDKLG